MKKKLKKIIYIIMLMQLSANKLLWLYSNTKQSGRLNKLIRYRLKKFTIIVSEGAIISEDVRFPHPQNIVIGRGCVIEKNVVIYQGVTLGVLNGLEVICSNEDIYSKYPNIKENVVIYANAVVAGGINVGKNAVIGANSFVNKSIGHDEYFAGNPAKIIKKNKKK